MLERAATIRAKTDQHWNSLPLLLRRTHDDDIDFTCGRFREMTTSSCDIVSIWLPRPYAVPAMVTPQ